MKEIKPCPFCGGKGLVFKETQKWMDINTNKPEILFYIACYHCKSQTAKFKSEEVASEQWNRRSNHERN